MRAYNQDHSHLSQSAQIQALHDNQHAYTLYFLPGSFSSRTNIKPDQTTTIDSTTNNFSAHGHPQNLGPQRKKTENQPSLQINNNQLFWPGNNTKQPTFRQVRNTHPTNQLQIHTKQ
ncbi:hypothetical protein D3C76_1087000 [compost metagenome]